MSRETLAHKAGVSFSTVARVESGSNWPTARTLERLATALDISIGDLLTGDAA